jgi:carbonic anhydrase/acetyltransferase-like protein (isoleucine patch superfamily)
MNLGDKVPQVANCAFVAPSASIIGSVSVGKGASIWYGSILRGDVNSITIGAGSNLQDGCVVHVAKDNVGKVVLPTVVGERVTVAHGATLHACTLQDDSFVGMGATVMDGAVVETGAMVAAGSLVTAGTVVPAGQIWAGNPAKFLRKLTGKETAFITTSASNYAALAQTHLAENSKDWQQVVEEKKMRKLARLRSMDYDSHLGVDRPDNAQLPA